MRTVGFTAAAAIALASHAAVAQDAYMVGLTGALTGPPASTYAPAVEALNIYIDRVNAAGGVNGKPIRLVVLDDGAQPSKAATNAKQLLAQSNVVLMLNASLSSTYAPVIAETGRAGVPLLFASAVCPKEAFPPADPLQFCTTGFGANYDSRAALGFIKATATAPVRLGFAAMAIPLSRGEIDFAEQQSKSFDITPVGKEIIPPPTPDYTPFATKLKDAGPTWVYSWAPWVTQIRTIESLRRLDWQGDFIAYSHLEAEDELARVKDGRFYVFGANALFQDDLPIHREIAEAAKKAGAKYPANQMAEGWIAGMAIEAAMRGTSWPATPAKVQAAMQSLKIDTKGLRGSPIEWTKENHFRTQQSYRVYRWDPQKNAIVRARDWVTFDVK